MVGRKQHGGKLATTFEASIVEIAVDPLRENIVAVACADGSTQLWDSCGNWCGKLTTNDAIGLPRLALSQFCLRIAVDPKQFGMLLAGHVGGSWLVWDDNRQKLWCKPQMAGTAERSPIVIWLGTLLEQLAC